MKGHDQKNKQVKQILTMKNNNKKTANDLTT